MFPRLVRFRFRSSRASNAQSQVLVYVGDPPLTAERKAKPSAQTNVTSLNCQKALQYEYFLMDDTISFPALPDGAFMKEVDWQYKWRREMQEIIPGLYLGPYAAATKSKLESLLASGITHIVCVRHQLEGNLIQPNFQDRFQYLVLDLSDDERQNIIQLFPKVNAFISSCLQQRGKVLVHGNGGTSRSAALVIGFVMQHFGLSFDDAFCLVQKQRFCICLNEGFVQQLKEYEPIYRAQLLQGTRQGTEARLSLKRKFEDEQDTSMDCDPLS